MKYLLEQDCPVAKWPGAACPVGCTSRDHKPLGLLSALDPLHSTPCTMHPASPHSLVLPMSLLYSASWCPHPHALHTLVPPLPLHRVPGLSDSPLAYMYWSPWTSLLHHVSQACQGAGSLSTVGCATLHSLPHGAWKGKLEGERALAVSAARVMRGA